jgi:DNA polymerase III subunit delta'
MLFSNIIGQQEVKQHLVEMVMHNRLSHALLFLGKEGSGALPLALAFANFVCLNPTDKKAPEPAASLFGEALPTNPIPTAITNAHEADAWMQQQPGFSKASQMVHPDIHYTYPVITKKTGEKPISTQFITDWREFVKQYAYGNSFDWLQFIGADNKQGNITAAECNDIIRKLSLKSFESPNKILVLWMPEYLEKEGNKLLKIIEEPPANTLFILVAESESQILPTILSRCQLVKIPALENTAIATALEERAHINANHAHQIAGIAEGNYREALQLLQHAEEDWQNLLREWLNALLKTGPAAQVKWIEEIAKQGREKQKQFLRYFNHLLQQSIRLRIITTPLQMLENERDFALRLNKLATIDQQEAIIEELDKAAYYIERNANAKMLFHALSIKLYHIIANKAVILIN